VLVPLPGELVASGGGLALIRVVSLLCFCLAALYAYRIAKELGLGAWPTGFALAYLALDQNQVFFGVAGMETQIAVAVLLAGVYYVLVEDYPKSGAALGLALLARPDFVLWVAPAYLFLLVRNPARALRAGLISAAVVAPWLIFTTAYYGSPIPNTIVAKNQSFGPDFPSVAHPGAWIDYVGHLLSSHSHDWKLLAPFYERLFAVDTPIAYGLLKAVALLVLALAVVGAVATWRRASWRPAIACVVLYAIYKIGFLGIGFNEWYAPPALALIVLLAAAGLNRIASLISGALRRRVAVSAAQLAAIPAVVLALAYAIQLPYAIPVEARVQHDIEDQVRVPLGQYLGRVVKPGQTIASESAGYVAYDTNATLYDFPGLVSTTVVDALKANPGYFGVGGVAALLLPDWLVMRPNELESFRSAYPRAAARYRPVRRFRVPLDDSSLSVGGLDVVNVDRDFIVLRHRSAGT